MTAGNRISVSVVIFMIGVFTLRFSLASDPAGQQSQGVKIVNPQHGPAQIKGESKAYYYLHTRIKANRESIVVFKHNDCLVIDQNGKEYSNCWIVTTNFSPGVSPSQKAPIRKKTLSVRIKGSNIPGRHRWNWSASMVDGTEGALEFKIPEGEFVELYFLWKVEKDFLPTRFKIGNLSQISG